MQLLEIVARLKAEFPNREVSFRADVWHHGQIACEPSLQLTIYDAGLREHINCVSLDDGIAKLHAAIAPKSTEKPQFDVDPTLPRSAIPGLQVCCRICGGTVPASQARKHYCEHRPEGQAEAEDVIMTGFIELQEPVQQ